MYLISKTALLPAGFVLCTLFGGRTYRLVVPVFPLFSEFSQGDSGRNRLRGRFRDKLNGANRLKAKGKPPISFVPFPRAE
jgi:hypothetical protein